MRCMVEDLVTVLLVHDPFSSLAYPMITHTPPVAGNLPIKALVAVAMANKQSYSIVQEFAESTYISPYFVHVCM